MYADLCVAMRFDRIFIRFYVKITDLPVFIPDLFFGSEVCDFSFSGYLEQSATGKMTVVTM